MKPRCPQGCTYGDTVGVTDGVTLVVGVVLVVAETVAVTDGVTEYVDVCELVADTVGVTVGVALGEASANTIPLSEQAYTALSAPSETPDSIGWPVSYLNSNAPVALFSP